MDSLAPAVFYFVVFSLVTFNFYSRYFKRGLVVQSTQLVEAWVDVQRRKSTKTSSPS